MFGPRNATHTPRPTEGEEERRPGKPIDAGRLLLQLFRRRWWIVLAGVLGVAGGVYTAKQLVPRTYESETAFVWEPKQVAEVRDLRTRVDSVTLPTRLEEVRDRLGLDAKIDDLEERLEVQYDSASNLVTVVASTTSAKGAQRLADAAVEVFLDHERELARTRREERVQSLRGDLERARDEREAARSEYDAFRREHGIVDLSAQRQRAIERAASLRVQAQEAEANMRASAPPGGGPGGAASPPSPRLREARRNLRQARAKYSDRHPKIQSLEAEVQAMSSEERSGSEERRKARRHTFEQRRDRFEEVSTQAEERLRELNGVEGRASELLASVRVAEAHLSDLQGKLADARDATSDPHSGFRVVAPALLPDEPASSWRKPVAIAIPVASVTLVVLLILMVELRGLRLRTASEVAFWGRAAVVGSSSWPRDGSTLDLFVDELGQDAVYGTGRTLVLPASDRDVDVADQLAEGLERNLPLHAPVPWTDEEPWKQRPTRPDEDFSTSWQEAEARRAPPAARGGNGATRHVEPSEPQDTVLYDDGVEGEVPFHMPPPATHAEAVATPSGTTAGATPGTALAWQPRPELARRSFVEAESLSRPDQPTVEVCVERHDGHQLRVATRRADRVLVVVTSGAITIPQVMRIRARLGRDDTGVAFAVTGLPEHLKSLADRAGPVEEFWDTRRI